MEVTSRDRLLTLLVLFYSILQVADACNSTANCLLTSWYFWFLLFWVLFFIGMAIIYCVKRKNQRQRTIHVEPPKVTRAKSPPPYSAPSHMPPSYTPHLPAGTMTSHPHQYNSQALYSPPSAIYPPPPGPTQAHYGTPPTYPPAPY